jgi:hypothetical protein
MEGSSWPTAHEHAEFRPALSPPLIGCACCVPLLQDETTRYRAMLRSQNLFNKSHSVSHNIITGEPRHNVVSMTPAP